MKSSVFPEARWRLTMLRFLEVELESARLFISLSDRLGNSHIADSYLRQASKAYETVLDCAHRVSLERDERERMQEELDFLGLRLHSAGGVSELVDYDPPVPVDHANNGAGLDTIVQQFLAQSSEMRNNAWRMTMQIRRMMRHYRRAKSRRNVPATSAR